MTNEDRMIITAGTVNIIELTQGKKVLVQGIIGAMATSLEWYYATPYGHRKRQILRNIKVNGKKTKENLKRFLCGLKLGEKARVKTLDPSDIVIDGKSYINYLTANLQIIRK